MATQNSSSSPLPNAQKIETLYVRLPNGKIVARTREELTALPPNLRTELLLVNPETGRP